MGFLKQLLGRYLSGSHGGGGHGNKHGYGGGKHGQRYDYPQQPMQNNYGNTFVDNKPGVICSSCNTGNLFDAKFCQQCGMALSSQCTQCRLTLSPDIKFCPQCGKARV
ncbi:MAG TPA: zinc ribbon domain-containing protein [Gammaproteobacteria bacterium]|nr:zinc ribbon domain-containing protein [Gammaproteobacteria bacterium]